jgi:hypothetical protein
MDRPREEGTRVSEAVVHSHSVLRVTRFASAAPADRIDAVLRDAMPAFLAQPGLSAAWFGRRTTAAGVERALVSVWRTVVAETAGLRSLEELQREADIGAPERIALPVAFDIRVERPAPAAILRIYDGLTFPGKLDTYVADARAATERDAVRPGGPLAVCMAIDRPDRFVTASVWSDWASLQEYTAGDISRPLVSRDTALLAGGSPTHYEIIASGWAQGASARE